MTVDPRSGRAAYVDSAELTHVVPESMLGIADTDGDGDGESHCGQTGWGWGPLSGGMETPQVFTGGSQSPLTNTYGCSTSDFARDAIRGEWTAEVVPKLGVTSISTHGLAIEPNVASPEVVARGIRDFLPSYILRATRTADDGFNVWAQSGGTYPVSVDGAYYPRKKLLAVDPTDGTFYMVLDVDNTGGGTGRDVWVAKLREANGTPEWAEEIHISDIDGDDFVAGVVAYDGSAYVGSIARNGSEAEVFMMVFDAIDGEILVEGSVEAPSTAHALDVALDPGSGTFFVAGQDVTFAGITAVGFDISSGDWTYADPFWGLSYASIRAENIEVDLDGDVYMGGIATAPGDSARLFVARDERGGSPGTTYLTRFEGNGARAASSFGQLSVNDAGIAYATGRAPFPGGSAGSGTEDVIVWCTTPAGDIRWDTVVSCAGDAEAADAVTVRDDDQAVLVAASLEWSGTGADCGSNACTHVLNLDHVTGVIRNAYVPETLVGQLHRRPRLIAAVDGGDPRVYTLSEVVRSDIQLVDELRLEAYDVDDGAVTGVSVVPGEHGQLSVTTHAMSNGIRVRVFGLNGSRAVVRLFDVTGRLVRSAALPAGRAAANFTDLASAIYFVQAESTAGVIGTGRAVVAQ